MAPHNTEPVDWQVNYAEIKMRSAYLWKSREWADCTFRFESPEKPAGDEVPVEETVEAHRLILAMASPVFAAMFYGNVGDKESPVPIRDIDLQIFRSMLDYIYTDEVDITSVDLAISLFRAANKYFLVHLEKKCTDYLLDKLDTNNVCHVYEFSCLYNKEDLKQKCLEMFSTKTISVLKGCSFNMAQVETLQTIYSMDCLKIESELDLFQALVLYIEAQSQEIQNNGNEETMDRNGHNSSSYDGKEVAKFRLYLRLTAVIEQIRFLTLAPDEFAECSILQHLLSKSEICAISMNISSAKTYMPMPAGFSVSRMPRIKGKKNKTTWTERITIKNVSKLKKYQSRIFTVGNVPWTVELTTIFKTNDNQQIEKRLLVYIICLLKLKLTWSMNTLSGVRVLPSTTNVANMTETARSAVTVVSSENDGTQTSFSWKLLTDPSYGVVRDDGSLLMEVYIAQGNLYISGNQLQEKREDESIFNHVPNEIITR